LAGRWGSCTTESDSMSSRPACRASPFGADEKSRLTPHRRWRRRWRRNMVVEQVHHQVREGCPRFYSAAAYSGKGFPYRAGNFVQTTGTSSLHPASMHPSMVLSISALERTPISAMNTIRARGTPTASAPPGANVARPPAS
jgi:hypothetical protein